MTFTLGLLCKRIPIRDLVLTKLNQKFPDIKYTFTLPLQAIINALGLKAIEDVFLPNLCFFLKCAADNYDLDYFYALMVSNA